MAGNEPLPSLGDPMQTQRFNARGGERDGSLGASGFRRQEPKLAVDPLKGVADLQGAVVQVDVLPSQPEQIATSQPQIDSQDVERRQTVRTRFS